MRKLVIIPGVLFGLMFAGGGFFFLSETAIPSWQNWSSMQSWRPAYAKLISVRSQDQQTIASYRYDYGGQSYQGNRVGVAEFSDNIGSYHEEMQAYLRGVQNDRSPLAIWVNPNQPSQAVIDRDMRWGLFAFMTGFCSIFILIGLAVIYGSIRGLGKQKVSNRSSAQDIKDINWQGRKGWGGSAIASNATRSVWFFWIFATIWNAISMPIIFLIPDELARNNYAVLVALLFPLVGLFLIYKAVAATREYRHFGKLLFEMDPYPGAIGGNVGGHIRVSRLDYQQALNAKEIWVRLECVYSYVSGSGKSRSRRESIKWAEQGKPKIDSQNQGVNLLFRFDVPENLPNADVEQSGAYHFWRLSLKADVSGVDIDRNYNIPVFDTGETSRFIRHDISAQSATVKEQASQAAKTAIASGNFEIDGLSSALQLENKGNEIHLRFPMFRNKVLTIFAAVFAGGFGFASWQMASEAAEGGLYGVFITIFGIPFFLVALLATIAVIYLPLNNLHVVIAIGEVSMLRRILFIPVSRKHLSRNDISHLNIKRYGSTGQGVDRIEHFKVMAFDKKNRNYTLAENIDGEDVARHFCDYLAQRIGVQSGSEQA